MNVIFLTISSDVQLSQRGIYTDLLRKFHKEGHRLWVVKISPSEKTYPEEKEGLCIINVATPLLTGQRNLIKKGYATLMIGKRFIKAIKQFVQEEFDLILYATPPITFVNVIRYLEKRNPQAKSYLLLKDIFPQNALDLGMLSTHGLKGVVYRLFRKQEKSLYRVSDYIGCMSPANVQYLLKHNPEVSKEIVEICPNSYDVYEETLSGYDVVLSVREKFHLPLDKPILIYGGNLGKPQGIPFLLECLKANKDREDCHFVLVGDGTEYHKIEDWVRREGPRNVSLYKRLPKIDYDSLVNACDIGLIFLDYHFTIPNYPSRLLSYLMAKKPILASTDPVSDVGTVAEANGYGLWCPSNNISAFTAQLNRILSCDLKQMGARGYQFYLDNYTVQHTYDIIMRHFVQPINSI